MYDAYALHNVAQKLPLTIECITARGGKLFAGTRNGLLLHYVANGEFFNRTGGISTSTHELQLSKNFAKRPIIQLWLVEECNLLICLSDGVVSVHDCLQSHFPVVTTLSKHKGVSFFTCDVSLHLQKSNSDANSLRLCVILRRKIHLFQWNGASNGFEEIENLNLTFPDTPRFAVFCNEYMALALRDEYFIVHINPDVSLDEQSRQPKSLFLAGSKVIEPLIFKIPDRQLLGFLRDDRTVFRDFSGAVVPEQPEIIWSEVPLAIEYDAPYLIGLLPRIVEIRTLRPTIFVQTIRLAPRFISKSMQNVVYIASPTDIWCLSAASELEDNIQRLLRERQFEIALQLCNTINYESDEEKAKRIHEIRNAYAFNLFCQKRFKESFHLYNELKTEVLYVIGLFPDLLPDEIRRNIPYPSALPNDFSEKDFDDGIRAVQNYLSEIRTNLAQQLDRQNRLRVREKTDAEFLSEAQLNEIRNLLQIVDTTLLKCYLRTNEMMVASLLRLPDNSCNVVESERILQKHQKYNELFLLYQRKGMHSEALDLLKRQSKTPGSSLSGIERTIHYLQDLGQSNLDLLFKYAAWVLKEHPIEGLKIFTEDIPEVETLPRDRVLEFLKSSAYKSVIAYLEHIIYQWDDQTPKFHDELAEQFVLKVKNLLTDYMQSLPEGHSIATAGKEPGEVGEMRTKLLYFLGYSQRYSPEMLLVQIPHDAMYEERAMILGRLGRHEQAIVIYTNILHDYQQAEKYCRQHYRRDDKNASQVFLMLLRMYANPPENSILGLMHSNLPKPHPNFSLALRVLKDYAAFIDTVKAVELLPADLRLDQVWCSVERLISETNTRSNHAEMHRGLYFAQHLRARALVFLAQSVKISVTHDSICKKCMKRIGRSAFVRMNDGQLEHYFCNKQVPMIGL